MIKSICNGCKIYKIIKAHNLCNNCYIRNDNPIKIKKHYDKSNKKRKKLLKKFYKKYYLKRKQEYRERDRKFKLNRFYNLTLEEYQSIFIRQNGRCAICDRDLKKLLITPDIDHNHLTGEVRGILCRRCNIAISYFDNDIGWLRMAIKYLKLGIAQARRGWAEKKDIINTKSWQDMLKLLK